MRQSIHFRWIAQAEARLVRQQAALQRAASEPHVSILYTQPRPAWFNRLRELLWTTDPTEATNRSPSSPEDDIDRVLVTVLITDSVGATERVAEVGDRAWHALLDRHDDATRFQIKRFGGCEVSDRGDGFVGIFNSPARAVRCAVAIVNTIAPLGISVR